MYLCGFQNVCFSGFCNLFFEKDVFFSESNTFQTEIVNNYKHCFFQIVCISQFSHV